MTKDEALDKALEAAYLAGFNASGEGYNGEYPFRDHGAHPEQDAGWIKNRDSELNAIKQARSAPVQPVEVDAEGENMAVRSFLMLYGQPGLTVGKMKKHMDMSGHSCCPVWVYAEPDGAHLTKAGAQLWIRHLFALEATQPAAQPAPVQEQVLGFDVVLDDALPPNTMKFVQPAPVQPVARVIDDGTPEGATEWIPYVSRVEPLKTGDLLYTTPPAAQPAPVPLTDGVNVPLTILEAAEASLGSFCSDHGWSDKDMQNMDNLSAYIAQHKAAHGIK
jgi:hypothetical protein